MEIYTIGHSVKPIGEFVRKLQENGIYMIVDVRTTPFSKYNPQFNRFDLKKELNDCGIIYEYRGKNLGGLGENVDFKDTIGEVTGFVTMKYKVCIMCSEADPDKCHRKSMLQPEFEKKGLEVRHILWNNMGIDKRQSMF